MRVRFDVLLALVFTVALTTPSMSQQPPDPERGCKGDCPDEACTPEPEVVYESNAVDLADWQDCDVCCVDSTTPDGFLDKGKQALIDKGVCAATVSVDNVKECTDAVKAAFSGTKLNVCILGHGAPGVVSMGAGAGANNGMAGGNRDDLDSVSKPFFAAEVGGRVEELHIFSCSTGQDWDFVQWLAQDIDADVKAPDKVLCSGTSGTNKCFWLEQGGMFHAAQPVHTPEVSWIMIPDTDTMTANGNWTLEILQDIPAMPVLGSATVTRVAGTTSGNVLNGLNAALNASFAGTGANCTATRSTMNAQEFLHVACDVLMKCVLSSTLPAPGTGPTDLQIAPVVFNGLTWQKDVARIPTVSEWGLIVMTVLGLTAGTIIFGRRRRAATA